MTTVIYDFGMNRGDNLDYYLKKAGKVVGVEANPVLCRHVTDKFAQHVDDGSLVVINCALVESAGAPGATIDFHVHRYNDHLSQLPKPTAHTDKFETISIELRTASEIIEEHGDPLYVKLDIEHMDPLILAEILESGIRPRFISAEMHDPAVYPLMRAAGYQSFTIVEGAWVQQLYGNATIVERSGRTTKHLFPALSAGPFGDDVQKSPWAPPRVMDQLMRVRQPGWRDLHASMLPVTNTTRSYLGFGYLLALRVNRKVRRDLGHVS